ncbi:hypothetical protein B0H14DRAFT_1499569 [Mycena olivaceomarginata]|nr:hypothetical protein B0H14DRAFT_1499569 [Mycena olivaceomarginata]
MHFLLELSLAMIILTGHASSRPIPNENMRFWSADVRTTQCFTQRAAIASDCQALVANPAVPDWTNLAPSGAPPVFRPFCSGSCCVFTDSSEMAVEDLISAGNTLMGCVEPANGLLNGVTKTESGSVCMADTSGANSCFHSSQ